MRAMTVMMFLLLLAGALVFGRVESESEQQSFEWHESIGTLKLFANREDFRVVHEADLVPRVHLDGEFVGHFQDLIHNTPAHFRLAPGKHLVRVEVGGYQPFESEIHLIGKDTNQYLCVSLDPIAANEQQLPIDSR